LADFRVQELCPQALLLINNSDTIAFLITVVKTWMIGGFGAKSEKK